MDGEGSLMEVLEGTWEEVLRHSTDLAGKRVRVTVVDQPETGPDSPVRPFYERATAEGWIAELNAWVRSHHPGAAPLSDEAVSREGIYGEYMDELAR